MFLGFITHNSLYLCYLISFNNTCFHKIVVPDSSCSNGTLFDENEIKSLNFKKEQSPPSSNQPIINQTQMVTDSATCSRLVTNNGRTFNSKNPQISPTSSGVRVSLPAFVVKVSNRQNQFTGIPCFPFPSQIFLFTHLF